MEYYKEHKLNVEPRFVKKVWELNNANQNKPIKNLNILPNGCFNIALLVGNGVLVKTATKNYDFKQGIYLCSQFTKPVDLTLKEHSKLLLVQLNAWYFSYLAQYDFRNFKDEIIKSELDNTLFNNSINLNSPTLLEETIHLVEGYFITFNEKHCNKNIVENIATSLYLKKGNCKVADILKDYNYSQRWIEKLFKKAIGLTPKQYAKIIQCRESVDKLAYEDFNNSLSALGYDSGFNDQSHFIKNFRQFSGISPKKFNPNSFVISYKE